MAKWVVCRYTSSLLHPPSVMGDGGSLSLSLSRVCLKMHLWKHGGTTTNSKVVKYPGPSLISPGYKLPGLPPRPPHLLACLCVCDSALGFARLGSRKSWLECGPHDQISKAIMWFVQSRSYCFYFSSDLSAANTAGFSGCSVVGQRFSIKPHSATWQLFLLL